MKYFIVKYSPVNDISENVNNAFSVQLCSYLLYKYEKCNDERYPLA